jgi:hypothetical protein
MTRRIDDVLYMSDYDTVDKIYNAFFNGQAPSVISYEQFMDIGIYIFRTGVALGLNTPRWCPGGKN